MTTKFQTRENPALYEINTAAWLFELSKKLGKPLLLGECTHGGMGQAEIFGYGLRLVDGSLEPQPGRT